MFSKENVAEILKRTSSECQEAYELLNGIEDYTILNDILEAYYTSNISSDENDVLAKFLLEHLNVTKTDKSDH